MATSEDAESLSDVLQELGYASSSESLRQRLIRIRSQGGEVFVADERGHIVGCVHALIDIRLAEGQAGEVVSLVVSSSHRGQGIGTELLNRATTWLVEKGCRSLRIRANAIRRDAHRYYQSHGFQEIKTQKIFKQEIA